MQTCVSGRSVRVRLTALTCLFIVPSSSYSSPIPEDEDVTLSEAEEHLSPEEFAAFEIWYAQKLQSLPASSKRAPSPSLDSEGAAKRSRTETTVSMASSSSSSTLSSLPLASPEEEDDDDNTSTNVGDDEARKVSPQPPTELPASLAPHIDANDEKEQRVLSLIWNSSDRTVFNLAFCAATYLDEDGNICWLRGTAKCVYRIFHIFDIIQSLIASLPPGVSLADYVGISLNPSTPSGAWVNI